MALRRVVTINVALCIAIAVGLLNALWPVGRLAAADRPQELHNFTADESTTQEIARVKRLWEDWGQSARSLRVSGWMFVGSCRQYSSAVPRERCVPGLADTLERLVLTKGSKLSLDELLAVTGSDFPRREGRKDQRPIGLWNQFTLTVDENDNCRFQTSGSHGDDTIRVRRDDEKEEMYRADQRQASVFDVPTNLYMKKRLDFVFVPSIAAPNLRMVSHVAGKAVITNGRYTLEYDKASGFVYSEQLRLSESVYLRDRIQRLQLPTDCEVPITGVSVIASYWRQPADGDAVVRLLFATVVTECEVNSGIDEKEFRLSVPRGTAVVHFPAASQAREVGPHVARPRAEMAKDDVEDVRAYVESSSFMESGKPRQQEGMEGGNHMGVWRLVAIVGANLAALCAIACFILWRRRSGTKVPNDRNS